MSETSPTTPVPGSVLDGEALYERAVTFATRDKPSTSYLQRRLQIGFNAASRLIERMEDEGLVSRPNSAGKRSILRPHREVSGEGQGSRQPQEAVVPVAAEGESAGQRSPVEMGLALLIGQDINRAIENLGYPVGCGMGVHPDIAEGAGYRILDRLTEKALIDLLAARQADAVLALSHPVEADGQASGLREAAAQLVEATTVLLQVVNFCEPTERLSELMAAEGRARTARNTVPRTERRERRNWTQ